MTRTLTPLSLLLFLTLLAGQARADGTIVELKETLITDLGEAHVDRFGRVYDIHSRYDPFSVRGRHFGHRSIDPFALERAVEDAVRTRMAQLRSAAERRKGVLLGGGCSGSQLDAFGWRVRAISQLRVLMLLPDARARELGTPVANDVRINLALSGDRGTAQVPVVLEELHRLTDDAKDEQKTLLGAALRNAWNAAGGSGSANGKVKVVLSDSRGNGLLVADGPGLNSTFGRRAFLARLFGKRPKQLPEIDGATANWLAQGLVNAETLARRGNPVELAAQVELRRGPVTAMPSQSGLTQQLDPEDCEQD